MNQFLNAYEDKIYSIRLRMKTEDRTIEFSEIVIRIKNELGNKTNTLFDIYDDYIRSKETVLGKPTIQKHKRIRDLLKEFKKNTGYKVIYNSISKLFEDKYFVYVIKEKMMLNSTADKTISFLKTFLNWAYERKLHSANDYKSLGGKNKYENEVIFLKEEELTRII